MTFQTKSLAVAAAGLAIILANSQLTARAGQTAPAQPGPVRTQKPCRTYDTSATHVTVGGPMKATIEWSGVFDPNTLRFTQNINFSSNQGSHFSYVQVSTFRSVEDFIGEVIRLKPPADLANNPANPGPVYDVVPPLTRSIGTVGNGQISLNKSNSFDTTNRLTGFTTRNPYGSINVRYSAWDASGRPTAGTMQGPGQTSAISIAYNDKALTTTETTTTQGLVSTMTYQYDQQGNMRGTTSTITKGQPSTTTITPHSSATLCLTDIKPASAPPAKPAGPNPMGTFTASIGGYSFTGALGVHAEGAVSVGAYDKRYIVSLAATARPGAGQYSAGSMAKDS